MTAEIKPVKPDRSRLIVQGNRIIDLYVRNVEQDLEEGKRPDPDDVDDLRILKKAIEEEESGAAEA